MRNLKTGPRRIFRADHLLFSSKSFVAAALALYVAFRFDLPRPYWAVLTVYFTSQLLTGALQSKALLRMIGTGVGATVAVVLVDSLANSPVLLSLAMAAWAGGCLYLSVLDRTPRAYVFMLAGYTAAIVGFPSVDEPGAIFDTAIARVEEITLGITCATLIHTVFFPRDVGTVLNSQIEKSVDAARGWLSGALSGRHGAVEERERRRLASDITELQVFSTHLPFDTAKLRPRIRVVRALQDRLSLLLPLLSGVEDRLAALRGAGEAPAPLLGLVEDVVSWAEQPGAPRDEAVALIARGHALAASAGSGDERPGWSELLIANAATRLSELVQVFQESRELADFIAEPDRRPPPHVDAAIRTPSRRPLHRDHGLAALSAFALAVAVLGCCVFWIATAWPEGSLAALMAAVLASFYASQDDPSPALVVFIAWSIVSVPIAAIYLFAVLPVIDGFPLMVAMLAPAFLVMGYLQADSKTQIIAMALIINIAGTLGFQPAFSADFPTFLNGGIAQIVGFIAALGAIQVFRAVPAGRSARALLRRGWRELADLARARTAPHRGAWTSAMLDRLGLLTPRLASARPDAELETADALMDLRVGLNLIDFKATRKGLHPSQSQAADAALAEVARFYDRRAAGQRPHAGVEMLQAIDGAIREVAARASVDRRQGLVALTGLRRALYPDAPDFHAVAA